MEGETLQELKTTKTWLGQKVVGPGYGSCEQWFFFGAIFYHLATKRIECNSHKVFV